MNKYHYVYKTVNKLNGMEYIGVHSTNNIDDKYLGSGTFLNNAIRKYGRENFMKEILLFCSDRKAAFEKEEEIVSIDYVRKQSVYNLSLGGCYPRGRLYSVKKFGKGEQNQLFIDFNNSLAEQYQVSISKDKRCKFYVDIDEVNRLNKYSEIYYLSNKEDITAKLYHLVTSLVLKDINLLCNYLTDEYNDKRYHKKAMKYLRTLNAKGWLGVIIKVNPLIAA